MRIISGRFKGRLIKIPKGIRPTQDKVRKALFDILGDLEGSSLLELFAGSGAVGLEAVSQGASKVVFVEKDPLCIKVLKRNLTYLLPGTYYLLPLDVFKAIKKLAKEKEEFDIIFLDPPYYQGRAKKTLKMLANYDILAPNGFMVIQHFKKDILPNHIGKLKVSRQARYGDTLLSFYRKR